MAERKRNRNALFLLDHKLYASDYDSDSVASENHCENRPLQAPLFRLSPARPRFSRNFSKSKSKSKYRYVGKIVWDITPTLR